MSAVSAVVRGDGCGGIFACDRDEGVAEAAAEIAGGGLRVGV